MTTPKRPSLYEIGCGATALAGLEEIEHLTGPILGLWDDHPRPYTGVAGIFDAPTDILTYLSDIDNSVDTLTKDIQANAHEESFMQSWATFVVSWKRWYVDHQESQQIVMAGRDATLAAAKKYQSDLAGWRKLYEEKSGQRATGPLPTPPPEKTTLKSGFAALSTTTKVLLALGGVVIVGGLSYATYVYIRDRMRDAKRVKALGEAYAERAVGAHALSGDPDFGGEW